LNYKTDFCCQNFPVIDPAIIIKNWDFKDTPIVINGKENKDIRKRY